MPFCTDLFYRYYYGSATSFVYPTILIHGFGGTHLSWPHPLRRIPGQRIFAIDLPGHGLSNSAAFCSARSLALYLQEYIIDMGFFHFALVGHSMGSAVAFELALLLPKQIRGLVLISFGNEFKYIKNLRSSFINDNTKEKAIEFLSQKGFHEQCPRTMRREILSPLQKVRLSVLQADLDVCDSFSTNHSVENFDFPVQLVAGSDDLLAPLVEAKKLKNCLPNASLQIINECGHMAIFEQTETVRATLQGFLEKVTNPYSL